MEDEPNKLAVSEKKTKVVTYTRYSDKIWDRAKYLVLNTDRKLRDIAAELIISEATLIQKAYRQGWMSKRDKNEIVNAEENLARVIKEVAYQINDFNEHSGAMIEAIQYSHRIKIIRDDEGRIRYRNFNDWPDKPSAAKWAKMSADDKQAHIMYIRPARLTQFLDEMERVTNLKQNTLLFVTKMTKGSLPKIDPGVLDISRRDTDDVIFDDGQIFTGQEPVNTPQVDAMIQQANSNSNGENDV